MLNESGEWFYYVVCGGERGREREGEGEVGRPPPQVVIHFFCSWEATYPSMPSPLSRNSLRFSYHVTIDPLICPSIPLLGPLVRSSHFRPRHEHLGRRGPGHDGPLLQIRPRYSREGIYNASGAMLHRFRPFLFFLPRPAYRHASRSPSCCSDCPTRGARGTCPPPWHLWFWPRSEPPSATTSYLHGGACRRALVIHSFPHFPPP